MSVQTPVLRRVARLWLIVLFGMAALLAESGVAGAQATFKNLYDFQEGTDGNGPNGGLIFDASGALYGTTTDGGGTGCIFASEVIGCGTVFKLTPPAAPGGNWTENVLHRFTDGSDGAIPFAGLIFDASGALYGAASAGGNTKCPNLGTTGCGTVFKLTPPITSDGTWTETTLYTFTGGSDGSGPNAVIFDASGALYGTTFGGGNLGCNGEMGCGTVFKLTPPAASGGAWTESVLYTFTGGSDGRFPNGLIFDAAGALYSTTSAGGNLSDPSGEGSGTVFKLTPPATSGGAWTERVLYDFQVGSDGYGPDVGVIFDAAGALYGTTELGGDLSGCSGGGCGTVYKLAPPTTAGGAWTKSTLYRFTGGSDGARLYTGLVFDASGALYGTAGNGGDCSI